MVKDIRNDEVVVEVAVESLLRQWDDLAGWLREQAQDLKDAERLERAAADWRASDRNQSWLLPGTRLAEAEALAAKPRFRDRLDPTRDYLDASRTRENQRIEVELQALTLRRVLALTAVVVAVANFPRFGNFPGFDVVSWNVIAQGLLLTVIAAPSLILRLLPRPVAWTGLVIGLVSVITGIAYGQGSESMSDIHWMAIHIIGPIWLIAAAALPSLRAATTWLVSRAKSRTGGAI